MGNQAGTILRQRFVIGRHSVLVSRFEIARASKACILDAPFSVDWGIFL